MEALRIVLTQASANYRKEESDRNKMTYPLPPYSTVIGAIHKACGFKTYHPMDLSIQGSFKAMHLAPYTDYCFLNSVLDDRGTLVKLVSGKMLNNNFIKVASTKKPMVSSIRKGIMIEVHNQELLEEYRKLFNQKEGAKAYQKEKFKTLITSLKYYEILDELKLILHIRGEETLLKEILENIYNLKAIGRSEDFVEVQEAKLVTLENCKETLTSHYSGYLSFEDVMNGNIKIQTLNRREIIGTKYYLNKNYTYKKNKKTRDFHKCKVIYASEYTVCKESENVWIDYGEEENYIVNFM